MKKRIRFIAFSALAVVAPLAAHAANLVTNGDFADVHGTYVSTTPQGGDDQLSGGTPVSGWTSASGPADYLWVAAANSYGLSASPSNGSGYFIDLTGQGDQHPYGSIQQTIATTVGTTYLLTFDLGTSTTYNGAGLGASAVIVSAKGVATQTASFSAVPMTSNDWVSESYSFTADSASTTLAFAGNNAYSSQYVGIDNVSLTAAVPEPADAALMLAGLGLIGAFIGRRRMSNPGTGA